MKQHISRLKEHFHQSKLMKAITSLIFFPLLFFSCDDELNTDKAISAISTVAKRKYNLDCAGSGIQGPNIIKNFRMVFENSECLTEDKARILIIGLIEDFISTLNSLPTVVENMDNPPVSEKHAYILISFINLEQNPINNFIAISLSNGKIRFLGLDELDNYKELFIEPYSESYYKVYGTCPPTR